VKIANRAHKIKVKRINRRIIKSVIDMTKLKCPELTCLRIYNVEDAKIIEFTLNLNQSKFINLNKIRIILYWDALAVKDHIGVGGWGYGRG
jgi:hypothetical protein